VKRKPEPKRAKSESGLDLRHVSQVVVVDVLGVSRQSVSRWKDAPRNRDGTYDLAKVVQWRLKRMEEDALLAEEGQAEKGKSKQLERLRKLRADMADMDKREREKKLVDADEVERVWTRFVTGLRAKIMRLPVEIRGALFEAGLSSEVQQMAQDVADVRCRGALNELAKEKAS